MTDLRELVRLHAVGFGIPVELANAVAKVESAWNPRAVSPAGAKGVLQLLEGTAKDMGVSDIWDPAQNIWGGLKYLRQQYDRFGDWDLALAAYNAGPERVAQAGGVPNIKETRDYLAKIYKELGGDVAQTPGQPAPQQSPEVPPMTDPYNPFPLSVPAQYYRPEYQQDLGSRMASNPFIRIGLGILGANRPGATFGEALGTGAQQGLAALEQWKRTQGLLAYQQQRIGLQQQALAQKQQQRAQLVSALVARGMDPAQAQAMVANAPHVAAQALLPQAPVPSFQAGPPPAGYVTEYDETGRPISTAPVPGGKEHALRVQQIDSLDTALANIDRMSALIKQHGSELWGPVAAEMRPLYGQIVSDIAKLQDLGVLESSEAERLEKRIPDPSTWDAVPSTRSSILRSYSTLRDQFQKKRESKAQSYNLPTSAPTGGSDEDPLGILK